MADMISESAARLFAGTARRAATEAWSPDLWQEIEEAGYPLSLLSEEKGGFGLEGEEAFAALRIAARHAAPVPLAETMVANWLLAEAGLPLAEGPAAVDDGTGRIPWGRHLAVLVRVNAGAEPRLQRQALADASWREGRNLVGEPRDELLSAPGVAVEARLGVAAEVPQALAALARAQQLAGAMESVLDMTVRYATERVQFGRPIAKFQAIQQYLAVMAEETAAASAAAAMGALALSLARTAPARFRLLAGAAKLRAGEAVGKVADLAHQIHGAIGFSQEYPLHELTRRLWSWRDEDGREDDWAEILGQAVLAGRARGLWPQITHLQSDRF